MKTINRNFAWSSEYSDRSFVGIFHEDREWNDEEYYLLENALYSLCEKYNGEDQLPRSVLWPVVRIFSYLMLSFGYQNDSNDGFQIENIDAEQFYERRERVQLIFEGFFKGEMPNKRHLGY